MDILTRAQLDELHLEDDQLGGVSCIRCGRSTGSMTPIRTPSNPRSAMVFQHPACAMAVAS